MSVNARVVFPVLSSPGPTGGMFALSFEGHETALQLRHAHAGESKPTHAGQRAVDSFLNKHGIADPRVIVDVDLPHEEIETAIWRIPVAVEALLALRDQYPGLSEVLYAEHILEILEETKIARRMIDGHRIRAAMDGGVHARVDYEGGAVAFELPEAAMIWVRVPHQLPSSAWTQAQSNTVARKRATGHAERLAATLLRAAVNDGIAIFEAFASADVDPELLARIPACLPAMQAIKEVAPGIAHCLEGASADLLLFSDKEEAASRAAVAVMKTFQAHALDVVVHAWSSIEEEP